jgi:hypothetical protein
LPDF